MDGFNQVSHPQMMSQLTESMKFQKLAFFLELETLWMLRLATLMLLVASLCCCLGIGLEHDGLKVLLLDVLLQVFDMLEKLEMLQLDTLSCSEMSLLTTECDLVSLLLGD